MCIQLLFYHVGISLKEVKSLIGTCWIVIPPYMNIVRIQGHWAKTQISSARSDIIIEESWHHLNIHCAVHCIVWLFLSHFRLKWGQLVYRAVGRHMYPQSYISTIRFHLNLNEQQQWRSLKQKKKCFFGPKWPPIPWTDKYIEQNYSVLYSVFNRPQLCIF